MKRVLFLTVIAGSMLFSGCSKSEPDNVTYKGVVIYNVCGNAVVQFVDAGLGQESWTDVNNADRPVYRHVFRVANPCQFGTHSFGDTISFHIVQPQVQRCAHCELYLAMPDTAYPIHVD